MKSADKNDLKLIWFLVKNKEKYPIYKQNGLWPPKVPILMLW